MTNINDLSGKATQGVWTVRNKNKLGSDIYAGTNGSYIGSFRSNNELPKPHYSQMSADAELACALVNAYRLGQLVHVDSIIE